MQAVVIVKGEFGLHDIIAWNSVLLYAWWCCWPSRCTAVPFMGESLLHENLDSSKAFHWSSSWIVGLSEHKQTDWRRNWTWASCEKWELQKDWAYRIQHLLRCEVLSVWPSREQRWRWWWQPSMWLSFAPCGPPVYRDKPSNSMEVKWKRSSYILLCSCYRFIL